MRVLVVDDDLDILELSAELFEMIGLKTTTCSSPNEVMSVLESDTFQAMVCDIVMAGKSGIELVQELNNKGVLPRPCVFITGYSSENPEAEVLVASGVVDKVFVKPLQFYEVADFLKKAKPQSLGL